MTVELRKIAEIKKKKIFVNINFKKFIFLSKEEIKIISSDPTSIKKKKKNRTKNCCIFHLLFY